MFVLSLFSYKTASIFKSIIYDCKDTVVVVPEGYWKSAIYYMIQRNFQLGRLVIVIVVTSLNLYYTGPGATFV